MKITDIKAREILDSRGNPTVEVDIVIENKYFGGNYKWQELRALSPRAKDIKEF